MTAELKAKWLAALRSGKYEQGREWLNKNNRFCCLGVLVEEAGWSKKVCPLEIDNIYAYGADERSGGEQCTLWDSPQFYELGLGVENHLRLIKLNDSDRWTFAQIADWVEANIPVD